MSETLEQLETRHADEHRAQAFTQAGADASNAATEAHLVGAVSDSSGTSTVGHNEETAY